MPRPPVKRPRQNSFIQKKRGNVPDSTQVRQVLQRKLSGKEEGQRPHNSDDSDDLITSRATGHGRRKQEIFASGAVAKGDKPGGYPTRSQRNRTMRENTVEILSQKSRSASRATSEVSVRSKSATPAPVAEKEIAPEPKANAAVSKKREVAEIAPTVDRLARTPQAEVSVLGKIKPRKRQASILQLIENDGNNDSSIINSDDEEQFLPDDISTPFVDSTNTMTRTGASAALKRKRGTEESGAKAASSARLNNARQISEVLSPLSRTQQRKLSSTAARPHYMDDIMAPPESSDEDEERQVTEPTAAPSNKKKRLVALSTEQLQSLMPSKKHVKLRQRQPLDEFDIPSDSRENSDDGAAEEEEDHSTFLPSKSRKMQKKSQGKAKRAAQTRTKTEDKSKSTKSISYTPSPVKLRTPLPLSSAKSGKTQAKSPSKQDTVMRDKSTNTPSKAAATKRPARGTRKQYGGSQLRAAGQENHPISLSDEPSGDEAEPAGQDAKSSRPPIQAGPEIKAWNKKWADIDNFSLDIEVVSASTGSSASTAR